MQNRSGVATIEFALISIPFIMMLAAIIEVALVFVMNVSLSNAVVAAARQIRVGAIQAPGVAQTTTNGSRMSLGDFETLICSRIDMVGPNTCKSGLELDVRTLSSYQSTTASPLTNKAFNTANFCFYSGVPGSVVQIRAYFLWPLINPLLWDSLENVTSSTTSSGSKTGHWMITSATDVFVNEPNNTSSNTGLAC
jgi:Flp pilus assembly protein TadG